VRFWSRRDNVIDRLAPGPERPALLLAHDPRRISEAVRARIPVMLSGHTHGGQIVLPLVGAVAARKFPVAQGILRRHATTLFVSRGIGTVFVPVRLNCPPEVAVLTLKSEDAAT
jgi:predicted MPP superfamily phosphohydrolase